MKKKFLSVILTLGLIVMSFVPCAIAATTFSDVLSPDHDWASKQIKEMTDLGIIKGYTDGTFRPDKSISKIEALLLFSRAAGYSNDEYAAIKDFAASKYEAVISSINLGNYSSFSPELAFALYKNILGDDELVRYLDEKAYSEDFPRSDAAILLANLMGADVKKANTSSLKFADVKDIPEKALPYVAYVVEEGLMNGVEQKDGTVNFDADKPLSRAQVSVLLYRIIDKLDMSVESGIVTKADADNGILEFTNSDKKEKSYVVPESANILIDGTAAKLGDISKESKVVVVRHGRDIFSVEALSPSSNETVKGTVTATASKATYVKLTLKLDSTGEEKTYYSKSADDFEVTNNGVADKFSSIKLNDYVVVKLLDSAIVSIDKQTSEATVQGVVEDIALDDPMTITVVTTDETTDKETSSEYTVDEDVSVRRDGERVTMRELLIGDKVVLTVTKGAVSKIVATSSKSTVTGSISSITISSQSKIALTSNGKTTEYPISMGTEYVVGGNKGSIYDLRLGNVVTLSLSGSTVTKVDQTTSASATTKSGTIESSNTSYGYINITTSDGSSEQIFASKSGGSISSKIIDGETGKDILFKNLKKGDFIIATGAYSDGAFIAKTIVVTPAAE